MIRPARQPRTGTNGKGRVIAFPAAKAAPADAQRVYGRADRLNPVFTEGRENACPCCNAPRLARRAHHGGRGRASRKAAA